MALPYFYEPQLTAGATAFTLSEDTSKHCAQVLRMKTGEQLHLTNGQGHLFVATILAPDKKHTEVKIESAVFTPPPTRKAAIGISLLKNNSRLEWFLEKATEIGISEIIPLICDRTERQHFRYDRMNGILIAAMLQSQQVWLPLLHQPMAFDAISTLSVGQRLVAHCEPGQKTALPRLSIGNEVLLLIGPEGDFSPEEIHQALALGFEPISLGNTRLRTETAGVVAATLIMNL